MCVCMCVYVVLGIKLRPHTLGVHFSTESHLSHCELLSLVFRFSNFMLNTESVNTEFNPEPLLLREI